MNLKIKLLFFLLLFVFFSFYNLFGQETLGYKKSIPEIITPVTNSNTVQGVIFHCSDGSVGKCWNPTLKDVALVEKGLFKYVLSIITIKDLPALLPKYHRFYSGVYKKGRKVIAVLLDYHSENRTKKGSQATPEINMPTFSLNFDLLTGKFSDFREEGYSDGSIIVPDGEDVEFSKPIKNEF